MGQSDPGALHTNHRSPEWASILGQRSRPIDFGQIVRRRLCQMAIQCKSSSMLRNDTLFLLQFITGIGISFEKG